MKGLNLDEAIKKKITWGSAALLALYTLFVVWVVDGEPTRIQRGMSAVQTSVVEPVKEFLRALFAGR